MGPDSPPADVSIGDLQTMVKPGMVDGRASGRGEALTNRYELLEEIGRGGFAVVWRARDRKLGRTVAVKRLLATALQGTGSAQTLERFRREAQAIAQHPALH